MRMDRFAQRVVRALIIAALMGGVLATPSGLLAAQEGDGGLPEVEGWALAPALIVPRSEQAVVALGSKIYLLGGYAGDRIPSDVVQIYDTATRTWGYGPSLPFEMHHAMAAVVGGVLYLIGGEIGGAGTALPSVFVNTVFALDPAGGDWQPRALMPTSRSAGGTAVIDGKIYVAGGRPPHGNDFAVYDPAADAWTALPDLPTGRNHLGVGAMGGRVYVAGGRFGGSFASERTPVTEVYDPATNTWSARAPMLGPRGGVASVVANGCLFLIGGEGNYADPRGLSVQNEAYDPTADAWIGLPPMPTPTHGLVGAAFLDGLIHLPGGSVTQGTAAASSIHWTYRPNVSCGG